MSIQYKIAGSYKNKSIKWDIPVQLDGLHEGLNKFPIYKYLETPLSEELHKRVFPGATEARYLLPAPITTLDYLPKDISVFENRSDIELYRKYIDVVQEGIVSYRYFSMPKGSVDTYSIDDCVEGYYSKNPDAVLKFVTAKEYSYYNKKIQEQITGYEYILFRSPLGYLFQKYDKYQYLNALAASPDSIIDNSAERVFHEVITNKIPQKLRFDFDYKCGVIDDITSFNKYLFAENIREVILEYFKEKYLNITLDESDIIFTNSSTTADANSLQEKLQTTGFKYSFHVIINRVAVQNNITAGIICNEIIDRFDSTYKGYFDRGVYKSVQNFRLIFSQKLGTGRFKILDLDLNSTEEIPPIYTIISYTNNCTLLPNREIINQKPALLITEVANEDINLIETLVENHAREKNGKFNKLFQGNQFRNITGNIINYNNAGNTYCPLCECTHKNENYLQIIQRPKVKKVIDITSIDIVNINECAMQLAVLDDTKKELQKAEKLKKQQAKAAEHAASVKRAAIMADFVKTNFKKETTSVVAERRKASITEEFIVYPMPLKYAKLMNLSAEFKIYRGYKHVCCYEYGCDETCTGYEYLPKDFPEIPAHEYSYNELHAGDIINTGNIDGNKKTMRTRAMLFAVQNRKSTFLPNIFRTPYELTRCVVTSEYKHSTRECKAYGCTDDCPQYEYKEIANDYVQKESLEGFRIPKTAEVSYDDIEFPEADEAAEEAANPVLVNNANINENQQILKNNGIPINAEVIGFDIYVKCRRYSNTNFKSIYGTTGYYIGFYIPNKFSCKAEFKELKALFNKLKEETPELNNKKIADATDIQGNITITTDTIVKDAISKVHSGVLKLSDNVIEKTIVDTHIYNEPSMREFPVCDTLVVKAGMKLGKTKALKLYVDKLIKSIGAENSPKIIILSFRKTFTDNMQKTFSTFVKYSDIKEKLINAAQLIIQPESLHKLDVSDGIYPDLLIMDESELIIEQMTSGLHKNLNDSIAKFKWLLRYSKKLVCMDANISDRTFSVISEYRIKYGEMTNGFFNSPVQSRHVTFVNNTYKNMTEYTCFVTQNKELIYKTIYEKLENGEKIVIPTSSLCEAKVLNVAIGMRFPDAKILIYSSETSMTSKAADMANLANAWTSCDVLIYTPTISAGISFEEVHFDSLIAWFSNLSCNTEVCMQMLGRVRNLAKKEMVIGFNVSPNVFLPTEINAIRQQIYTSRACLYTKDTDIDLGGTNFKDVLMSMLTTEYDARGIKITYDNSNFLPLILQNIRVNNLSKNEFAYRLIAQLAVTGIKFKLLSDKYSITKEEVMDIAEVNKGIVKEIKSDEAIVIANSKELYAEEIEKIENARMMQKEISLDDKHAMAKFKLRNDYKYGGRITEKFIETYNKSTIRKHYKNLRQVLLDENTAKSIAIIKQKELENYEYAIKHIDVEPTDIMRKYNYGNHKNLYEIMKMLGFVNYNTDPESVISVETVAKSISENSKLFVKLVYSGYKLFMKKSPGSISFMRLPLDTDLSYTKRIVYIVNNLLTQMYGAAIKLNNAKTGYSLKLPIHFEYIKDKDKIIIDITKVTKPYLFAEWTPPSITTGYKFPDLTTGAEQMGELSAPLNDVFTLTGNPETEDAEQPISKEFLGNIYNMFGTKILNSDLTYTIVKMHEINNI